MKFKKNFKKGFTLVELIVVIAIVAILAAVSVISYLAFINQANESADVQLVKQLNVALQADETLNGKRPTMHEMLGAMEDNGFVVENLTKTKSGYDIVWDQTNNRFALTKADNKLVYGESTYDSNVTHTTWKFVDNGDEANTATNQNYSIYLTEEFAKSGVTNLDVKAGLDVGNYSKLENISYNTTSNESVVIRTNGGKLTVNAPEKTVKHYGEAQIITLTEVGTNSYYEHGSVNLIDIKKGRLVITNDAEADVGTIYLSATGDAYDDIIIATQSGSKLPDVVARQSVSNPTTGEKKVVTIQTNVDANGQNPSKTEIINLYPSKDVKEEEDGYNVSDLGLLVVEAISEGGIAEATEQITDAAVLDSVKDSNVSTKEEVIAAATLFAGGKGTEEKPYLIATAEHWNNFYQAVYDLNMENKTAYFELVNDIDLSGVDITNYAVDNETNEYDLYMNFVLDGKENKLLSIETLKGYGQLFPNLDNSIIKNITIDYKVVNAKRTIAMAYDAHGECYFTNVTTTGEISTTANWATAFVAYSFGSNNIYYTNCTNMTNIKGGFGNNAYIAVFGSHNGGGVHITFDNCKNYGGLLGGHVGFVGMGNDSVYTFVDENAVQNYGSMTGTISAGYFKYDSTASSKTIGGVTCEVKKGSALATTSTTHTNSAPANFNDAIVLNEVAGAVKYEVEMSFSIQVYNYDNDSNANKWSGGFPRSMVLTYSADDVKDGKLTTQFKKGYVGEVKADKYYGYGNTTPSYDNGVFVPAEFDISSANIVLNQGDIYLVKDNGDYYYVFYSEQDHGWYTLLTTDVNGNIKSNAVTVSFSVTAYNPDGSVLSFSSFSYASPVEDARDFFNN